MLSLALPLQTALAQATPGSGQANSISRLGVRISSSTPSSTVTGVVYALDPSGNAVADVTADSFQASVDGRPVRLSLLAGRPPLALAAAFMLDSSATAQARFAVANSLARAVEALDARRDSLAIVSTAKAIPWEQARFTTSPDDLRDSLNAVIQTTPDDAQASLGQLSGVLRALNGRPTDARVLLLFVNRPLASAASVNASLGALRSYAADNGIQVSVVALPGIGAQGPAEALAEATPAGRVEYVLNATNTEDISRRISMLLAPVFGARRFELSALPEGSHVLTLGAPGVLLQATAPFQVTGRAVQVASLQTSAGPVQADTPISQSVWVQAVPVDNVPIDSVEWSVDGRVTQSTSDPWALLLDPEQLGDGRHEISARIVSQGRAGPFLTNSVIVPPDLIRGLRNLIRGWGIVALLVLAEVILVILFLRLAPAARAAQPSDFAPLLRRNALSGAYVAPDVIEFPTRGKLRLGYHPPYMDNHVGSREFARLPYRDIRGDSDAVNDLSRHAAVIWRDRKTNDCYIQLGWTGAGESVQPKPQSQVFHLGRPQDATSTSFRLAHHDIIRLGNQIEYVFNQIGLADKSTPEARKISPFDVRAVTPARFALLDEPVTPRPAAAQPLGARPAAEDVLAEEG